MSGSEKQVESPRVDFRAEYLKLKQEHADLKAAYGPFERLFQHPTRVGIRRWGDGCYQVVEYDGQGDIRGLTSDVSVDAAVRAFFEKKTAKVGSGR